MSEAIRQRREQRREFLRRLYDQVDGSVSEFVDAHALGAALGLDKTATRNVFEYLEEKGLVFVDDHRAGTLRITAAGVDVVEAEA
jgi:predicted ArsR family transcriptional regulator